MLPLWQQAALVDVYAADDFLPPSMTASASGSHGLAMPLSLVAQLLEASQPSLGPLLAKPMAAAAIKALRFGEEVARLMPTDAPLSSKALLKLLSAITSKLRAMTDGEMAVVPIAWLSRRSSATGRRGGDAGIGRPGVDGSRNGG